MLIGRVHTGHLTMCESRSARAPPESCASGGDAGAAPVLAGGRAGCVPAGDGSGYVLPAAAGECHGSPGNAASSSGRSPGQGARPWARPSSALTRLSMMSWVLVASPPISSAGRASTWERSSGASPWRNISRRASAPSGSTSRHARSISRASGMPGPVPGTYPSR
ncbi:hypothetical protein [Planomonospora venezuelensis]|uniref:hypothetical protein n=1 Tax=Planomonospora venezuelensis TaxID=1999 RepID=UPI0031EBA219